MRLRERKVYHLSSRTIRGGLRYLAVIGFDGVKAVVVSNQTVRNTIGLEVCGIRGRNRMLLVEETQIRLTAAKPERQLWGGKSRIERDARDTISSVVKLIAAEAVTQIRSQLTPEEQTRLSAKGRVDPEAYDEYLRGRFFLDHEPGQKDKAIPHLEHAIQIDQHFAAAYALLGEAWGMQGVWGGMSNQEASAKALQYSREAVSLDPTSSEAFASLGHSLMQSRRWNEGWPRCRFSAATSDLGSQQTPRSRISSAVARAEGAR